MKISLLLELETFIGKAKTNKETKKKLKQNKKQNKKKKKKTTKKINKNKTKQIKNENKNKSTKLRFEITMSKDNPTLTLSQKAWSCQRREKSVKQ